MYVSNKDIFREVITETDQKLFDDLWNEICVEYDVNFLPYHSNSQRFFIMAEDEKVGTIEFTKREPKTFSVCEEYFPFEDHSSVLKDSSSVFEIGKISIKDAYRRNGHIHKIIECIYQHAKLHDVAQYIGFMNLDLYKILWLTYGLRLERLGGIGEYERHQSIPVLCDVKKARKCLQKN